jgi:hypothetical protein
MLQFTRHNRLAAAAVALLLSVSAVGMTLATSAGGPEHPPAIAVAVIPETASLQRKQRYAATRVIRWRLLRRGRENQGSSKRRRQVLLRRHLRPHERDARGPPR